MKNGTLDTRQGWVGKAQYSGRTYAPGLLASAVVALAAMWVAQRFGGPVMLYALLLGMGLHTLSDDAAMGPGIQFVSRTVLRMGVGLLGARITMEHVLALGVTPVVMVVCGVTLTLLSGWLLARLSGGRWDLGVLTGGSVAICGASAALAVSAVLPRHADRERHTVMTVVAVTAFSTVAMVLYPMLARALGFDDLKAGMFLGGSIHDVAQVVGAGYMISDQAGEYATFVKLMRVVMLVPVVLVLSVIMRRAGGESGGKKPVLVPLFLIAFVLLATAGSLGWMPAAVVRPLSDFSSMCLVLAIAALGMKTSFAKLATVGWKPVLLILAETVFLAVFVLTVVLLA